jgi:hypothetical protein
VYSCRAPGAADLALPPCPKLYIGGDILGGPSQDVYAMPSTHSYSLYLSAHGFLRWDGGPGSKGLPLW